MFKSKPHDESMDEVGLTHEAMDLFSRGKFLSAEEKFQKVHDRFPFSPYATLAELRLADCKFHEGEYEEAIGLYQEFEKLHPTNEAVPYVIFQEGNSYYRMMDTPDRDQNNAKKLIEIMERLTKRFPDSPYDFQARRMIAEARENLAQNNVVIAKWYMKVDKDRQAKKRLEYVVNQYPETKSAFEAERLLRKLGVNNENAALSEEKKKKEPFWKRAIPFI